MLADLKAWLRIGSDDEDGVLERLLGSASGLCEQFIGQWLVVREASETIVADGSWRRLTARPVVAILGVEVEGVARSEEHTSELQSLMRISYAVFCLKKKNKKNKHNNLQRTR